MMSFNVVIIPPHAVKQDLFMYQEPKISRETFCVLGGKTKKNMDLVKQNKLCF